MVIHHIINDIDLANGGAQKVVRLLHRGLRRLDVDSRVVTLCEATADVSAATTLRNPAVYRLSSFRSVLRYIKRHCRSDDILHAHLFPSVLYVCLAVRWLRWKGPVVFTEHSTSNRRRKTTWGRVIDRFIYSRCNGIAAISQGAAESLAHWQPRYRGRIQCITNGVEPAFTEMVERGPRDRVIILSAGRLHALKNYDKALMAVAALERNDVEYWIAGQGPEEQKLKESAESLGLEGRFRLLGFVPDLASIFRDVDILLIPSKWEGFGLAAIEAMNAGLPVVASNLEGLREVVTTNEGILVDPNDVNSIARALQELVEDYEKRRHMGRRAFERSFEFSAERMVNGYIEFYRSHGLRLN